MSNEIYYRLLGQRPLSTYPGDPVPVVSWLESRRVGAGWWSLNPTVGPCYRASTSIQIDPPAGGFAADDVLFDMPSSLDFQQVVTTSSYFPQNFFVPGLYHIRSEFIFNVSAAATIAFYWQAVGVRDGASPGPQQTGPLPSTGASRWTFMRGGTPSLVRSWEATFLAQENWKLLLRARSALVDLDVISLVDMQVECIVPLDKPTGQ